MVYEFKVRVAIFLPTRGEKEPEHSERVAAALTYLHPLCNALKFDYHLSKFVYYPDESAESAGAAYDGVNFYIHRILKKKSNCYHFAKVFEGLAAVMNSLKENFERVEFEIL